MLAYTYKDSQIITNPHELKLINLPFKKGQRVEILIVLENSEAEFDLGKDIGQAMKEVRASQTGKIKKKTAMEFLDEL